MAQLWYIIVDTLGLEIVTKLALACTGIMAGGRIVVGVVVVTVPAVALTLSSVLAQSLWPFLLLVLGMVAI